MALACHLTGVRERHTGESTEPHLVYLLAALELERPTLRTIRIDDKNELISVSMTVRLRDRLYAGGGSSHPRTSLASRISC